MKTPSFTWGLSSNQYIQMPRKNKTPPNSHFETLWSCHLPLSHHVDKEGKETAKGEWKQPPECSSLSFKEIVSLWTSPPWLVKSSLAYRLLRVTGQAWLRFWPCRAFVIDSRGLWLEKTSRDVLAPFQFMSVCQWQNSQLFLSAAGYLSDRANPHWQPVPVATAGASCP